MNKEIVDEIVQEFRREVERLAFLAEESKEKGTLGDLGGWEQEVREGVQPIQRKMLRIVVNLYEKGYEGPTVRCEKCGEIAKYMGDRGHGIRTLVGGIEEVRRAYYHGCACEGGWFPQDEAMGLRCMGTESGAQAGSEFRRHDGPV